MQRSFGSKWKVPGFVILLLFFLTLACNMPTKDSFTKEANAVSQIPTEPPESTQTVSIQAVSPIPPSPTLTVTQLPSNTPPPSITPTTTESPTTTPSLTPETASAVTEQNVNCRWGPSKVYMHAGLFADGSTARIDGRNYAGTWLWIQMEGYKYNCWVATSAVIISGDLDSVPNGPAGPPINSNVPVPTGVYATRDGKKVIISWNAASPAVDLHYLIRAETCNGQFIIETVDTTNNNAYTIQDKPGCSRDSKAQLHVVTKTGYSQPVSVPWPD